MHRRRTLVWPLIVLASVVLIFSIIANWVQTEALETQQVEDTTDEIVRDEDVREALATFTVDQLYANVDVQGEIQQRLPGPAQPLAAPVAAATRQLATNVAERALASPQVQNLVSTAVGRAHEQFVSLIEDEGEFASTTGGDVTLQYGSVVADLAARLGVDPATISQIQAVVQEYSVDLRQRLAAAQTRIESARATLSQAQSGELSSEGRQDLQALNKTAAGLQGAVKSLEKKVKGVQSKVPDQLQAQLSQLQGRLSDADARLTALNQQTAAVLKDPTSANVQTLDASLASLQPRITTLLERQAVQTPGQLVLMSSSQLEGLQTLVSALRNLGFVLPVLALLLYMGALYLAKGWRREALIAAGGGILMATLFVLLLRRLIGNGVDSVAASETVKPAITSVWDIISAGLRQRALFVLAIGVAFIGGGLLAGPGRHEVAVRRFLAPYLRDHPVAVYSVIAALFLLWLSFIPGINNVGQVLVIVVLAALAVVGIEILRRQTAREFPASPNSP
jgi:transcriptional regulator with XRE-family HTH domain